jgi:hypothetical protein
MSRLAPAPLRRAPRPPPRPAVPGGEGGSGFTRQGPRGADRARSRPGGRESGGAAVPQEQGKKVFDGNACIERTRRREERRCGISVSEEQGKNETSSSYQMRWRKILPHTVALSHTVLTFNSPPPLSFLPLFMYLLCSLFPPCSFRTPRPLCMFPIRTPLCAPRPPSPAPRPHSTITSFLYPFLFSPYPIRTRAGRLSAPPARPRRPLPRAVRARRGTPHTGGVEGSARSQGPDTG